MSMPAERRRPAVIGAARPATARIAPAKTRGNSARALLRGKAMPAKDGVGQDGAGPNGPLSRERIFVWNPTVEICYPMPMSFNPMSFTLLDRFSTIAPRYDVVLCDIWGVVHNGIAAHDQACDALVRFRIAGGTVVLVTNAPRPAPWVIRQLDRLGVPRDAYDVVMTSGDLTRDVVARRKGQAVFHIGPERDLSIFDGLDLRMTTVQAADYVVCSGLFDDEKETPDDYRDLAAAMRARGLFLVCANPDLIVERGDLRLYCAGAIADLYGALGGEVLYAGKPHRPIYDAALAKAAGIRGAAAAPARTLAIGDSLRTDITGARAMGVDGLFVSGGIHAQELGPGGSREALAAMFAAAGVTPWSVTARLAW
jgi:HAD superfamily hydrolase (TIGR01459 family)